MAIGAVHRRRIPRVGDLAFFDDTYDRNQNGIADDELTHIAVVTAVDDQGTITLAHGGTSAGRSTILMNLRFPDVHRDQAGMELNGYLRAARKDEPRAVGHLTGELWRGFATVRAEDRHAWMNHQR